VKDGGRCGRAMVPPCPCCPCCPFLVTKMRGGEGCIGPPLPSPAPAADADARVAVPPLGIEGGLLRGPRPRLGLRGAEAEAGAGAEAEAEAETGAGARAGVGAEAGVGAKEENEAPFLAAKARSRGREALRVSTP
jgi:hypothetical protein